MRRFWLFDEGVVCDLGVSQNCAPHKRAERYSHLQCVYVVCHAFLGATQSAQGF